MSSFGARAPPLPKMKRTDCCYRSSRNAILNGGLSAPTGEELRVRPGSRPCGLSRGCDRRLRIGSFNSPLVPKQRHGFCDGRLHCRLAFWGADAADYGTHLSIRSPARDGSSSSLHPRVSRVGRASLRVGPRRLACVVRKLRRIGLAAGLVFWPGSLKLPPSLLRP